MSEKKLDIITVAFLILLVGFIVSYTVGADITPFAHSGPETPFVVPEPES